MHEGQPELSVSPPSFEGTLSISQLVHEAVCGSHCPSHDAVRLSYGEALGNLSMATLTYLKLPKLSTSADVLRLAS